MQLAYAVNLGHQLSESCPLLLQLVTDKVLLENLEAHPYGVAHRVQHVRGDGIRHTRHGGRVAFLNLLSGVE